MDTFLLPAMKFWCRLWAGSNKSYLLGCIEICKSWMALCQSVWKEEHQPVRGCLSIPAEAIYLKSVTVGHLCSSFCCSAFFLFFQKRRLREVQVLRLRWHRTYSIYSFFCKPINSRPYEGLLTVFHHLKVTLLLFVCMVPLSRCPFGRTCYGKTCTFSLCTMH